MRKKAKVKINKSSLSAVQNNKWKKSYGLVGSHSSVDICEWTKKSFLDKGMCYKNKFYDIDTHRCCEISPATAWCQEKCIFCWRPMEWYYRTKMGKRINSPKQIIEGAIAQRRKLINGFKGNPKVNMKLFMESYSLFPSHWAISLSGEPTLYPKLPELVLELKRHKEVKSIFIVSNGQEPSMILKMKRKDALPTQLYISLSAPNKILFDRINRSVHKDGWKRLNRTLSLLPKLDCRTVIRLTLIKGMNDDKKYLPLYSRLLKKSKADFIETKAFMFLGQSRKRLKQENMPRHAEVLDFSKKLLTYLKSYHIQNQHEISRIVLLKRNGSKKQDNIRYP
ncbi:MAG: 4-demethylwyosine synthase TYW1 [Candidatus Micrarchaeota archaeon]|nr:4-demethylwyosine synthase TYW1 [Candidatus Micrarchaeota archaeon]